MFRSKRNYDLCTEMRMNFLNAIILQSNHLKFLLFHAQSAWAFSEHMAPAKSYLDRNFWLLFIVIIQQIFTIPQNKAFG